MEKNLALTGMMGVGKTTVGKALSRRLLMQFSDIDKIIENKLEMSIQKIFDEKGEIFFRKLEEKITLQEVKKKNIIISLGGCAFMNLKIRKKKKKKKNKINIFLFFFKMFIYIIKFILLKKKKKI